MKLNMICIKVGQKKFKNLKTQKFGLLKTLKT